MRNKIIKITKKDFPNKLKIIKNCPLELYCIGNIELLYKDSFTVIGTRKISEYGVKNCEHFTSELAYRDIPVVSGLALGTDSIAHKTALKCDGETIAVIGSGFENIFPVENKELFENIILNRGLVISEYKPDVPVKKENFPNRNRIIAAISEGVLVIEATYRSGTSITVRYAKEQSKKVFAIPRKIG